MRKEYKTPKELSNLIEDGFRGLQQTSNIKEIERYKLQIVTSAQDYYTVTGCYYHRNLMKGGQENE